MKSLGENILHNINKGMSNNLLSNGDLVEIFKLAGDYLNLTTPSDYKDLNNISYQGARKDTKTRTNIVLFNTKYIIDND